MSSTFFTTTLMKNLKKKFAELHVRLVTGHCYGVVSYKASHATAIIFWSIVLPIWVLIFPYSSTSVLCCRPLPPRLMHAYPCTFKIIASGPYCNVAVEEEKVSASSVQESVWCVWKWFWACLDCRMMEWWLVWIHKYHMTSLVCIEKLNKILGAFGSSWWRTSIFNMRWCQAIFERDEGKFHFMIWSRRDAPRSVLCHHHVLERASLSVWDVRITDTSRGNKKCVPTFWWETVIKWTARGELCYI
jgi:hypothetical protein